MDMGCAINLIQNSSIFIFVLISYFFVTNQEPVAKPAIVFFLLSIILERIGRKLRRVS